MTSRYATQTRVKGVGDAGQGRIESARVLVVGAGGLGSTLLPLLAGAGVGFIRVVDPDTVEVGNLHRQTLYRHTDLGRPKADVARDAMLALNPNIEVQARVAALDPATAAEWMSDVDIIVDAADQWYVTYALSDQCRSVGKPMVSASVQGQSGYVGVFCGGAPGYRAVFPDWPTDALGCQAAGVLGPAVAILGAMQAQLALALVLGSGPDPRGRLLRWDGERLGFSSFDFSNAPDPDVAWPLLACRDITSGDIVIDLRTAGESKRAVTPSARHCTPDAIEAVSVFLPLSRRIVLACRSGIRAARAAAVLDRHGHDNIALLAMGDDRWYEP